MRGDTEPEQTWTPEAYAKAREAAMGDLKRWIVKRYHHKNEITRTGSMVLLGPVLDAGTYYFRMGVESSKGNPLGFAAPNGKGMYDSELRNASAKLTALGFPGINPTELQPDNVFMLRDGH